VERYGAPVGHHINGSTARGGNSDESTSMGSRRSNMHALAGRHDPLSDGGRKETTVKEEATTTFNLDYDPYRPGSSRLTWTRNWPGAS